MIRKALNSRAKTVTFAAGVLAVSSFFSQFLGIIRDRLLAGHFGAGPELDIYFAAFKIPDFVYGVLIVGGITGAFLPVFSSYFGDKGHEKDNEWPEEAQKFANNVLNCFFILLIVVCGVLALFAPFVIKLIIPGFSPENKDLTISLARIMFLSPILFGLSSIFSGIVQFFNKFFAFALAPILYNCGIIAGILFLVPIFGIYGLAYGVILGALMYFLIQILPAFHSGFIYRPILDLKNPGLKKIFYLMVPRSISSAVYYINLIFITALASTLTTGSVAIFTFSDNIQSFPAMLIGISFAISAFPMLSRFWASGKKEEFVKNFSLTFRQIVFLTIPASVLIFLLRIQIIRLLLGAGKFGWWETRLCAAVLGIYCFSIIANSLIPLLTRAFFSLHNTKTPMIISIASIFVNVVFSFFFLWLFGLGGTFANFFATALKLESISNIKILALPLALSVSAIFQFILLFIFLKKTLGDFHIKEILKSLSKVLLAAVVMGIVIYAVRQYSANFVDMHRFLGIFVQTIIAGIVGAAVFTMMALLLKTTEIHSILSSFFKQFKNEN